MTTVVHGSHGHRFARVIGAFPDVEFIEVNADRRPSDLGVDRADVLFVSSPYPATLDELLALPVRWVHHMDAGVDSFPLELVGDRTLTCGRGANAVAIAEWAMAMILADTKRLPDSWIDEPPDHWYVTDLALAAGATVAILGFGQIGREVARRALAFDMTVRVLRRSATPIEVPGIVAAQDPIELVTDADHVVIAAPLTPELHHVLDDQTFGHFSAGTHLVNVSRGAHVDQDALRRALDHGQVRRASLDVCDPEPLPADHWLYHDPRVRLSPHVSWFEPDATKRLYDAFADNLRRFIDGLPLHGVVDIAAGY
ncbi:MAG: hydroxyacid dehydrogenase [Acidimicrobiia bacterium]|nr:hydroxyacid dehydrogenase [Acidimicrobiia bacterium]